MKQVQTGKIRAMGCGLIGIVMASFTIAAQAAKPPSGGGGGPVIVSTTTSVQGDWTITRLLTPQQYPAVGYDVGYSGGMAQIGQIDAGARYLSQTVTGWQKQLVSSSLSSNALSFSVAPDGRAAMAFAAGQKGALQYAERNTSGVWSTTTVESQNVASNYGYLDLEFDSAGNPAIAYNVVGTAASVVKLARRNGSVWQTQTVTTVPKAFGLSLGFDGAVPVIAHGDDPDGDGEGDTVRVTRLSGSTWNRETVVSGIQTSPSGGGVAYIELSVNPVTHEAEVVHGRQFVRFDEKVDGVWISTQLEDSSSNFGASLDHDSQGRPHVALRRNDGIWHLSREAGVWTSSFIRNADPVWSFDVGHPIVRIDEQDRPTVLYTKDSNGKDVSGGHEMELARRAY